jgi:hypothetical protein
VVKSSMRLGAPQLCDAAAVAGQFEVVGGSALAGLALTGSMAQPTIA